MGLAGERLKKIRLEKGLSLKDISKKTKIHMDILEALEEDRIIDKAPVYIKGFIRMYCQALGVNPEDFLGDITTPETAEGRQALKVERSPLLPKPQPTVEVTVKRHFGILKIAVAVVLLFILVVGAVKITQRIKNRAVSSRTQDKPPSSQPQKSPIPKAIRLTIRARENCWIKASVDAKVVFVDVLKKGHAQTWQAQEKIELSLGNAGGIDMELNGQLISPLGKKGQVIRQVLITKQGLKIIR